MALSAFYFDVDPTSEFLDDALRFAKQAAEFDSQDAGTHFVIGRVHLARGEYDLSIAELQASIDLNPCFAQAHCGLGDTLACAGRPDDSLSSFDESIRLSPRDPRLEVMYFYKAHILFHLREFEASLAAAKEMAGKSSTVSQGAYLKTIYDIYGEDDGLLDWVLFQTPGCSRWGMKGTLSI